MNYVALTVIVVILSASHEKYRYNALKQEKVFLLILICLVLCGFAGLRSSYNDTKTYIAIFQNTPDSIYSIFHDEFMVGNAYLYKLFNWFLYHFISTDYHVYFFIASAMFVVPSVFAINKYSETFTYSMFLFMTSGLYLFSLAAIRQSIAIGILVMAVDAFIEERYKRFICLVLIATSFHFYAVIVILIMFIKKDQVFGLRMTAVCLVILLIGLGMTQFSGYFSSIATIMGKEISATEISTGSVSVFRAAVYIAPVLLVLISKKAINQDTDKKNNVFVTLSVLSGAFMVLALFGNPILIGRLPYYFLIGMVISLPNVIKHGFNRQSANALSFLAIICYCIYEIHELKLDEAFSRDIFNLIWF